MKFLQKIKMNSSGITLMEVMISVTILSMGIVGSFGLVSSSMSKFSRATNKIIASNLAQDGLERVRNVRDTNWRKEWTLASDGTGNSCAMGAWDCGIEGVNPATETIKFFCGDADTHDKIPSSPDTFAACGAACQINIYTKSGNQCYSDNFGNQTGYTRIATNFYRLITLKRKIETDGSGTDYIEVTVNVMWTRNGQSYYLTPLKENLYNWKGTP